MARWNPPTEEVGANEQVGRRLFDEPLLAGALDQPPFKGLLLTHFEETRGNEWSLDRLGKSSVDRKVVNYLLPRAKEAARQFHIAKRFDGWVSVRSQELRNPAKGRSLAIVPSPVVSLGPREDENDLATNLYHAHVKKPDDMEPYLMALHLRDLFTRDPRVHEVNRREVPAATSGSRGLIHRLVEAVSARLCWRHH